MRYLIPLFCLLLSGCAMVRKLPAVKASDISSTTSVMGVAVSADATGVTNTGKTLKAANATFKLSFPGFSHVTTVKDYEQKIPAEKEDTK